MDPTGLHVVRHHLDAPGLPVVIVHGAPDRGKNFAHVVHLLHDFPVTIYDRRGYGRSLGAGEAGGGFDRHADDLIELLDGKPSVVVGQSAGGALSMLAATKAPDLFLALGVWEPPMVPWEWWMGKQGWDHTMTWAMYTDTMQLGEDVNRQILGDARWDQLRDSTQQMLRAEGAAFRADMTSQRLPYFELDQLKVPLLVGCGTVHADPQFSEAHWRLAKRTDAELFVADGADHFAHTNHPTAWVELVHRTVALAQRASVAGEAR